MLTIKCLRICFWAIIISGLPLLNSYGQTTPKKDIHAVARKDGRAFIYHAEAIPLSHGFNVYRSTDGDKWTKITDTAVYPATNGNDFKMMLGDTYPKAKEMAQEQTPQAVFLRLRSGTNRSVLTSFALPEVAKAVGRLYVDKNAPIGKSVYYRFQIVDNLGKPTGKNIQGKVNLKPMMPPAPDQLEVENKSRKVTLKWHYVPYGTPKAQNVIRFQIYYRKEGNSNFKLANPEFIARTIQKTQFHYIFKVPKAGQSYEFVVRAVDFTEQTSEPSKIKKTTITENVPPSIIKNVKARATSGYSSQLTWPVSTELDLQGYNIYRASGDSREYKRINERLIPPLEPAYRDSALTPGTLYRYKIAAVDTAGNIGTKSNAANVFIGDYRKPDSVSTFTAVYHNKAVQLHWDKPKVPGKLNTFLLLRRQSKPKTTKAFTAVKSKQLTDTTFVDPGVGGSHFVDAATYQYGIAVISQNGQFSDTVYTSVRIPDRTPPQSPGFVKATMQEGHRVSLRWNASASTDVTQYRVYRKEPEKSDSLLAAVNYGQRYFRDKRVPLAHKFIYSVRSVDSVGNVSKNPPRDTLVTRRLHPPAPVRNVQAVQMGQGVTVAWNASGDDQVSKYQIYRSKIATGIYKQIGKVPADTTRWQDSKGKAGLWYKVFPVDAAGQKSRTAEPAQAISKSN